MKLIAVTLMILAGTGSAFYPKPIFSSSAKSVLRRDPHARTCPSRCTRTRARSAGKASDEPMGDMEDQVAAVSSDLDIALRTAGPQTPKPTYSDDSLFDRTAIEVFRRALANELGGDTSSKSGYEGVMDLALILNRQYPAHETRARTRAVLRSLFPPFIIKLFPVMFAKPFPAFSAKLNAWITSLSCVWLMGSNSIFDVEPEEVMENWGNGKGQGLLVERCRFLEESACASVCINTCKVPTQEFFARDMGIPLSMEPDYETFECKFKFGKAPLPQQEDDAFRTACFLQCPSKGALRAGHSPPSTVDPPHTFKTMVEFEELCDSIAVDTEYDGGVPSGGLYWRKIFEWVRGNGAGDPP